MANRLRQAGVAKGTTVGISAGPEVDAIATVALMQLGAISMSRPATGWSSIRARVQYLIVGEPEIGFPLSKQVVVDSDYVSQMGAVPRLTTWENLDDTAICRVVFSSGTTGIPKGIPFSVGTLNLRLTSAEENWLTKRPFMSLLGLDTVSGFLTLIWSISNGQPYLAPGRAAAALELMARFQVVSIKTSPAKLLDLLVASQGEGNRLDLEEIQVAGSLLSSRLALECEKTFGVTPSYLYGSTEVGTVARAQFNPRNPRLVGAIVRDVLLEIVTETGQLVTQGDIGTIRYRRPGGIASYWAEHDGQGFKGDWFYPGDLGQLDETGGLIIQGRTDDVINAGGFKINLSHLDQALDDSGLFLDVAAFRATNVDGQATIGIAFVLEKEISPEVLVQKVQALFPSVPFSNFSRYTALPKNHLGKVNRGALS